MIDLIFDSTVLKPLFWMVMGAILVLFFYSMRIWFNDLGFKMKWWKWLMFLCWFFGLYVVIAGGFTLIGENETRAGILFISIFGSLLLVSSVGLWYILKRW